MRAETAVTVCWAPECGKGLRQSGVGREKRYCGPPCKMRAARRNGGKAPAEPYPPLEILEWPPAPAVDSVASRGVTVDAQLEQKAGQPRRGKTPDDAPPGRPDAAGKARRERRDSVQPSAVATAGKASAPKAPPRKGAGVNSRALTRSTATPAPIPKDKGPADHLSAGPGHNPEASVSPEAEASGYPASSAEDLDPRAPTVPVPIKPHAMVEAYRSDLEKLGQLETRDGQKILEMAGKLVSSAASPAASANLSKELDRLMEQLEAKAQPQAETDASNIIRERVLRKLGVVGVKVKLP